MTRTALIPTVSLAGLIVPAAVLFGQTLAARQTFEVASIRRVADVVPGSGVTFSARAGGRLVVENNEATNLIGNAYGVRRHQLIGGPAWITTDRYNIQAKAPGDATRDEMMAMLQSLLEERFKLKVHRETRELPIYVLTVAKGGLKLQPSVDGSCVVIDPRNPPRATPGQPRLPGCGNNNIRSTAWNASSVDMTGVAEALVGVLNRSVVNKTGVSGKFDIHVQWTPDQAPTGVDSAPDSAAVSLFTVLEEQLGVKVESARGPVDVLVIEHIDRPTDD